MTELRFPMGWLAIEPETFDGNRLAIYLGAVGVVIIFSGLVSGFVERGPVSQVAVFVALGVIVGPWGLDVVDLSADSLIVQTAATVALVLVFFTDAIKINLGQLRSNWLTPALVLGPGALLTIGLTALAAGIAFDLPWAVILLVAIVLAATDAVLLRDVLNNRNLPRSVRHTLSIEAGANDVAVLPLLLVIISIATGVTRDWSGWIQFGAALLIVGPIAGVIVAYLAIRAMGWLRRRQLIRRDYESIYSIGVSFTAFATAQLLGGSGFIAAFAAGLTIALVDEELCDCFLEYGETTAEMAMLLTFVFLGAVLVQSALDTFGVAVLAFAVFTILVARPMTFVLLLQRANMSLSGKLMIAWFGPRGLSSILLAVLVVAAGVPQGSQLFGIVSFVVILSMIAHGASATPVLNWYGRHLRRYDLPEEVAIDAGALLGQEHRLASENAMPRMPVADLKQMLDHGEPVTVIDVRREAARERARRWIPGSIRIPVDDLRDRLEEIPRDAPVVLWCA